MKKIIAICILTLFVISAVPLSFAQDARPAAANVRKVDSVNSRDVGGKISKCVDYLKDEGLSRNPREICKRFANSRKACVGYFVNLNREGEETCADLFDVAPAAEEVPEKRAVVAVERPAKISDKVRKVDTLFKKRVIASDRLKRADANFNDAKENFMKARENYEGRKAQFNEVRERLRDCEGDECDELRGKALEHSKEVVINGAKRLIEHLNKIKSKVEGSEDMDEDRAEEIIAEIDSNIAELEEAISNAEAAETKEELKEAAKTVREIWKKIKHRGRLHAAWLVHSRVWNIIQRSEQLEARLDKALADMEENGIEVEGIDAQVDEFSNKVAEAKDKFEKAEELLKQARDLRGGDAARSEIKELVDEAKALLREAHQDLKEAHKILVGIVRSIKSAGGDIPAESDAE